MAKMIRLKPSHTRILPVDHPLFDSILKSEPDVIDIWIQKTKKGDEDSREKLILSHLPLLRHTVGRYLGNWPVTHRYLDEMVSTGVTTIVQIINALPDHVSNYEELGTVLFNHVCAAIEDEIARLIGIVSASPRTNRRRLQHGDDIDSEEAELDVDNIKIRENADYIENGFDLIDALDAIQFLMEEFSQLNIILKKEYWGLTSLEVAERTGISRQTIDWYRQELYKRYQRIVGEL